MKILNLYAGIGGNRKFWGDEHEITAVEFNQSVADAYKDLYPNDTVVVGSILIFLGLFFQWSKKIREVIAEWTNKLSWYIEDKLYGD